MRRGSATDNGRGDEPDAGIRDAQDHRANILKKMDVRNTAELVRERGRAGNRAAFSFFALPHFLGFFALRRMANGDLVEVIS